MADISDLERVKLESVLEMSGGYVLGYSDRTFQDIIIEKVNINIYENDKYTDFGTSKAKRFRSFWKKESNHIVGTVLLALIEKRKYERTNNDFDTITEKERALLEECLEIAHKLMNDKKNEPPNINIDIRFKEIQSNIIKHIEEAKFTIWIAVAWFTDKTIYEKLIAKKCQGLNIQLIICDDDINNNSGLNYMEFETYKAPSMGQYENIMHNKFCIIDLNKVIHGSYNWTNRARFNSETIITLSSRQEAEKFAEEFIELKKKVISISK